ncbi:uncharacterized protein LOC106163286 [Lingula anatina]|uniref:Uncharacterized protein LOC106163286 n=1 Tax=Lingula anatina TaxID=7574 RepID=A0A1S3IFP0_LINAN|nr:uncharacterized protein LOC106163286 [Lingula anatina]|eukprot:XP_013396284.1 uncharacterized protein LOC106163286 [Lingula anatina]
MSDSSSNSSNDSGLDQGSASNSKSLSDEQDGAEVVLSEMNDTFKKSKRDLLMRFLQDQETLNKRFQEFALNSDSEGDKDNDVNISSTDTNLCPRRLYELRRSTDILPERPPQHLHRRSKTSMDNPDDKQDGRVRTALSTANVRRRRYRMKSVEFENNGTMDTQTTAIQSAEIAEETPRQSEKKVLSKISIRPKSAMGPRRQPVVVPTAEPIAPRAPSTTFNRSAELRAKNSSEVRYSPDGRESPEMVAPARPSSPIERIPPTRKLTWQEGNSIEESEAVEPKEITNQLQSLSLDGVTTIGSLQSTSSGDSEASLYSSDNNVSTGNITYQSQTIPTEFSPVAPERESQHPLRERVMRTRTAEDSNLHRVIKWTPHHRKTDRRGHPAVRRYISLDDTQSAIGVRTVPAMDDVIIDPNIYTKFASERFSNSNAGAMRKSQGLSDLSGLRGRGRPIKVLKLPPLEHSKVIKKNVPAATSLIGGPTGASFAESLVG